MTTREPAALIFAFGMPLIAIAVLGLAFRNRPPDAIKVVIAEGPGAEAALAAGEAVPELALTLLPLARAREELRRGRAVLVVVPGPTPELIFDPTRPESRTARLLVTEALRSRAPGERDPLRLVEFNEPGARYVDFLVPGLLGYGLMNSGIWGVAFALVRMRGGKMLKRFAAASMSRWQLLLAFMTGRAIYALLEIAWLLLIARVMFAVPFGSSLPSVLLFGVAGALCFTGLSVLLASRTASPDTALGLGNLLMVPMLVLSGVFFPSTAFPAALQPVIALLPLTALNDGLRILMLDGGSPLDLGRQFAILGAWGVGGLFLGLKLFRWT